MEITTEQIETAVQQAKEIPNGRGAIVVSRDEYRHDIHRKLEYRPDGKGQLHFDQDVVRVGRNSFTFSNGFEIAIAVCTHWTDVDRLRGCEWNWLIVDGLLGDRIKEELGRLRVIDDGRVDGVNRSIATQRLDEVTDSEFDERFVQNLIDGLSKAGVEFIHIPPGWGVAQ